MARHTINVSLSEKSINKAIEQLKRYENSLNRKCKLLVERIAELGEKATIMRVS